MGTKNPGLRFLNSLVVFPKIIKESDKLLIPSLQVVVVLA